jgi:protease-4
VKAARGFGFDGRPKVALVYAVGDIVPGESESSPFGGGLVGSDTIIRGLRQARQDGSVRAIILRIDSPGGSGTARRSGASLPARRAAGGGLDGRLRRFRRVLPR